MGDRIRSFLYDREQKGLLRCLCAVDLDERSRLRYGSGEYANFSSNDYLGLSAHPGILDAYRGCSYPVSGTASSRLLTGTTPRHQLLEKKTAAFKNKEAALLFNSGYQANIGLISAVSGRRDAVFSDKLNHASIIDGIRLSGADLLRFRHNDARHLDEILSRNRKKYNTALIVAETVYSMDGDLAPLEELVIAAKKYDCMVMVDEAHATGIFGENGSGLTEQKGVFADCDIIMGTFSKALGSFGAYAAVSGDLKEYLINDCRSFIYSTSLPVPVVEADMAAIDIVRHEPERRKTLLRNAEYLRDELRQAGFHVGGESQIVPVILGDSRKAALFSDKLRDRGYWVMAVRPPTVPPGSSRLRFSVTYNHSRELLSRLVEDMCEVREEMGRDAC